MEKHLSDILFSIDNNVLVEIQTIGSTKLVGYITGVSSLLSNPNIEEKGVIDSITIRLEHENDISCFENFHGRIIPFDTINKVSLL